MFGEQAGVGVGGRTEGVDEETELRQRWRWAERWVVWCQYFDVQGV